MKAAESARGAYYSEVAEVAGSSSLRLTEVNLCSNNIGDEVAPADSPHLPEGVTLGLYGNRVRGRTKEALRKKRGARLWSV